MVDGLELLTFHAGRYHGGGWCAGTNDSEELINRKISKTLNVIVFSIAYRLAPENPFPVPFNDAEDGLKWVCPFLVIVMAIKNSYIDTLPHRFMTTHLDSAET